MQKENERFSVHSSWREVVACMVWKMKVDKDQTESNRKNDIFKGVQNSFVSPRLHNHLAKKVAFRLFRRQEKLKIRFPDFEKRCKSEEQVFKENLLIFHLVY